MMPAKSLDLLFRLRSVALSGFRGKPRADIAALLAAAAGIGDTPMSVGGVAINESPENAH
jgi:hypothetical protein